MENSAVEGEGTEHPIFDIFFKSVTVPKFQ